MPIINEACFSYTVILVVAPCAVTSIRNIATRTPTAFELSNLQATSEKISTKKTNFLNIHFLYQISINTSIWFWSKKTASMLQYNR
jgi:hypothetical protein